MKVEFENKDFHFQSSSFLEHCVSVCVHHHHHLAAISFHLNVGNIFALAWYQFCSLLSVLGSYFLCISLSFDQMHFTCI